MEEHALHLHQLIAASQPAPELGGAAAAGAGPVIHRREVARAEADERIGPVEEGDNNLAHLAGPQGLAGLGIGDLDDGPAGQVHAALRVALVGQAAAVGGAEALADGGPEEGLHRGPQRVGQGLRSGEGHLQAEVLGGVQALLLGPLADLEEERGHPHKPGDAEVAEDLNLNFPVAHARGYQWAAQGPEGIVEHHPRRRHLVAEGVDAHVTAPEAGGEQGLLPAPALVQALGVVDGARGAEDPADLVQGHGEEAAEGRVLPLHVHQLGLGSHRQLGQVIEAADVARRHARGLEEGPDGGGIGSGVGDDALEPSGLLVPLLIPAALLQVLVQESCGPVHGVPLSGN